MTMGECQELVPANSPRVLNPRTSMFAVVKAFHHIDPISTVSPLPVDNSEIHPHKERYDGLKYMASKR